MKRYVIRRAVAGMVMTLAAAILLLSGCSDKAASKLGKKPEEDGGIPLTCASKMALDVEKKQEDKAGTAATEADFQEVAALTPRPVRCLSGDHPEIRKERQLYGEALKKLQAKPGAVELAVTLLQDKKIKFPRVCLAILGSLKPPGTEKDIFAMIKTLSSPVVNPQLLYRALETLASYQTPAAADYLFKCLDLVDEYYRRYVIRVLSSVSQPKVAPRIISFLNDSDSGLSEAILDGCIRCGNPAVVPEIKAFVLTLIAKISNPDPKGPSMDGAKGCLRKAINVLWSLHRDEETFDFIAHHLQTDFDWHEFAKGRAKELSRLKAIWKKKRQDKEIESDLKGRLSHPVSTTLAGSYDTPGNAKDVYVSASYAYVADNTRGLQIIDISNPARPVLKGSYDAPVLAEGVYISGSYAYVAGGWNPLLSGLRIIDISNPASPTLAGDTPPGHSFARGVYVSGSYAYVADRWNGLQIIDISNPASPALAGSYDTRGCAQGVYVKGSHAYVADGEFGGLQIIDISNPASPALAGSYDTPGNAWDVYVSGSYAYVADRYSGLQIIDISNPASPTLAGSYDTPGWARGVYVSGSYAYVADWDSGLQIIRISE